MKKLLTLVLAVWISGCLGTRHGNPVRGDFAAVTSEVAAVPSSTVAPVQTKEPAKEEAPLLPERPLGEVY